MYTALSGILYLISIWPWSGTHARYLAAGGREEHCWSQQVEELVGSIPCGHTRQSLEEAESAKVFSNFVACCAVLADPRSMARVRPLRKFMACQACALR
jgi:hypothetical protein